MEAVKAWGVSLCMLSVAVAVVRLLAPKNGLGRLLELTAAAVFLCGALTPLVRFDWAGALEFSPPLSETAQSELFSSRLLSQLREPVEDQVQKVGDETLSIYGLSAEKIEVQMDIGEEGGIYITKIVVTLNPQQAVRRMAVKEVLETRFQVTVEVVERTV